MSMSYRYYPKSDQNYGPITYNRYATAPGWFTFLQTLFLVGVIVVGCIAR